MGQPEEKSCGKAPTKKIVHKKVREENHDPRRNEVEITGKLGFKDP